MAEWVMSQREQQLSVSESTLLLTARKALGENSQPADCYSWAVDFLLRHELGVQPSQHHRGRLPRSIRDNSRVFIQLLSAQVCPRLPFTQVSIPLSTNTKYTLINNFTVTLYVFTVLE